MAKKYALNTALLLATLLLLTLPDSSLAQTVDDLILLTENYPPYNFEDENGLRGVSTDLLVMMLKRVNSKLTRKDIQLLPWARGYAAVLNKKNSCLFSTTRTAHREKLFKWVGPILPTTIALTARKDRNIKINSIEDIKKYRVGVVMDDIGEQLLVKAGIKLDALDRTGGVNAIDQSIAKLNRGRIDLWSYERNVANWEIRAKGFDPGDYETVFILEEGRISYAFHKDTPDSVLQKLQHALDELKREGEYQKIVNRYVKSPDPEREDK